MKHGPSFEEWLLTYRPMAGGDDAPPAEDTPPPEPAAPEGTPAEQAPAVDYEKRYQDLQPEFTRASQEAAEYRQKVEAYEALYSDDPEARQKAAETLGFELPEEEVEEYADPYDELKAEIKALRDERDAEKLTRQEEATQAQLVDHLDDQFNKLQISEKVELSDDEVEMVTALAIQTPGEDGLPDVGGAYKKMLGWATAQTGRLAQAKRAAQAPQGVAADKDLDMSNREARIDATMAALERHQASQ